MTRRRWWSSASSSGNSRSTSSSIDTQTTADFRVQACRGYDPESKGKVEAGVKYVKQDALYGDTFHDETELRCHVQHWLDTVANVRIHGTTGQSPRALFEADEQAQLRPYITPACVVEDNPALSRRKVDKTGLISWHANKYSVPMRYQRGMVGAQANDATLSVLDLETGEVVATHALCHGKGHMIRNRDHYRDPAQDTQTLALEIEQLLGATLGQQLCARLKASMPRHYKDQLAGAKRVLQAQSELDLLQIEAWVAREGLTAGKLKQWLAASQQAKVRGRDMDDDSATAAVALDLTVYAQLGHSNGQPEVTHGTA